MKMKYFVGLVAALGALFLPFSVSAQAAGRQLLHGHVPPAGSSLQPIGSLAATNHLRLAIGLPLRDQATLSNLLHDLYDPASPQFHQYLTPEAFAQRFGPAEADYQTLSNFAETNGFRITSTHPNRVLLDVDASVRDIERALHVKMLTYRHPAENRTFYAPDTEPSLDLDIPVLHISGLDNYSLPRPRLQTVSPTTDTNTTANLAAADGSVMISDYPVTGVLPAASNIAPISSGGSPDEPSGSYVLPNAGSGPSGSYMGADFRAAYAPGVSLNGSGQSVGLLQFDGYSASDITFYETKAGLPSVTLSNVLIDGATGLPSGTGGEVEVSLDIEMAISMAPGLSKVYLYEAPNSSPFVDILNRMATDNLAKQLSCSWYQPNGPSNAMADQIFQQMAAQGQSFFSASGDYDAYTGLIPFPGDTPYITEVGGTTLTTTGAAGPYVSETVWNRGNGIGTGGGISTQYPIPSWQTNINMGPIQGSSTKRNVPDVALTAENVYVRADSLDQTVGGTSCAAPLWAGFTALINQQAKNVGKSPIGFLNPAVYALGAQTNYPLIFHDTTNGNNTSSSSPTKFYAAVGYDLCTGWGTPSGQKLIDALAPPVIVSVPPSATEGAGVLAGAGQIQLPAPQGTNLTATLTSSDPTQVTVPASITILAGQTNATFDLTVLDDGILDGTQIATIAATVPGLGSGSANISIFDKETATLQVLLPASVTKGQGSIMGTVQVSAPVGANVIVSLSSSSSALIQVPSSVLISNGQTSAVFAATVLTDGKINGGQTVNVTAHVQNWTDGVAAVSVLDNINLAVSLPGSAWENAGVLTNAGSVSLAGTAVSNIVVTLVSSKPSKLIVPANVTILAGTLSNSFNVTPVDDPLVEGHQTITVIASAPGFNGGSASMLVLDKETPPFPGNPRPANLAVNVPANTNLMWNNGSSSSNQLVMNGGFETGTFTNWLKTNSTIYGDWVIDNATYIPPGPGGHVTPFAGTNCALSEQTGPGIHTLYQDITIPSAINSASLSWADCIRNFATQFTTNTQYFHVEIRKTDNTLLQIAFTTMPGNPLTNNWTTRAFNLTPYIGQTIRIAFVESDSIGYLNVGVDNVSVQTASSATNSLGAITNDVYFGTDPVPGPADYQGSTTNTSWSLPLLAPQTTYYWQIIAHRVGSATGAVWQFTTAGVDHFAWSNIPSPQIINQPFGVTITAQDAFNTTVSNFSGPVSLQCFAGGAVSSTIEDFESGIWPHSPWISAQGLTVGTLSTAYAHDGIYGLSDPEWMYRTDVSLGNAGDGLSWWIRPGTGRAYLGFGASSGGCWSIVAAVNTAQFILQQNAGYNYTNIVAVTQSWVSGKWYRVAVQFSAANTVTCNLYDSDGTTLLNTVSYSGVTGLPGGVAMRSFGVFSLDTITSGGGSGISLPLSPTNSGTFVNGIWSGSVTVQAPATNAVLRASDGNGHSGNSNPFDVHLANDIYISSKALPSPVSVGANLTYTLTIANTGPTDATSVMFTNILPANVTFISAASSQGTWSLNGGVITASLGVVSGGASATITIVVTPTIAGMTLTNIATISRAEADAYLGNNTTTNLTSVTTPAIFIADSSCLEGNVGTTNMFFAVSLAVPSAQTISVNYATANGTAIAGKDYVPTNGLITFAPGVTNQTIAVAVIGNTIVEPNKTFFVNLSNPINGTVARSQATGTIINDDGLPGQIDHFNWSAITSPQFIGQPFNVTITALDYSNNIATNFNGAVSLSASVGGGVATNMILGDLVSSGFSSGCWTMGYSFTPNTNLMVTHVRSYSGSKVSIWTDAGVLLAAQNVNSVPGTWVETPLPTPLPLNAGSTYRVAFYTACSNYYYSASASNTFANGTINLSYYGSGDAFPTLIGGAQWWLVDLRYMVGSSAALPMTPSVSDPFTNGVWSGNMTIPAPATNATLLADDGNGHTGSSNPFDVDFTNDISISIAASPSPVSVGADLTYTLTISNTGPADATDVLVSNALPANVATLSIIPSQGACSISGGMVIGSLGTVPGGSNATITVIALPTVAGTILTNTAIVSRGESDAYLGNNTAINLTQVTTPAISIADSSCLEGNVGTTNMLFSVTLAVPSAQTITVNYATADNIALAGKDYLATNGLITFAPGVTNQTVAVAVIGNTVVESNKTFFVNLSNPINGTLARGTATGTIINDDGLPGQIDHFNWNAISSPQYVNVPFGVTITALDYSNNVATNFNGIANLSAFIGGNQTTNLLLQPIQPSSSATGTYTWGYPFTPTNNIVVTHFRSYFGNQVSLWTGAGVLLASQNVTAASGSWNDTALTSPLQLVAGSHYVVAAYVTNATYYWTTIPPTSFADGFISNSVYTPSNSFPTFIDAGVGPLVGFRYIVGSQSAFPVSPTNSGNFSNGLWSGNITVPALATNAILVADDGNGHTGSSNPFDVLWQNDISISIAASPSLASAGTNLTYTLYITNTGPTDATGVIATNVLPANASFVSATSSQGTCSQSGGLVIGNLGTVPGGSNATITIMVTPNLAGTTLTNSASISRAEPDTYLGNNSATNVTQVTPPAISIADSSCLEGNVGTTNMLFTVTLSAPSAQSTTVNYATANGIALAGKDYIATNGVISFAPGVTNQTIATAVIGNTIVEPNKTFFVNLSNPINGTLARSQATGTIINDDGLPGQIFSLNWSAIPSPQSVNVPFGVTIMALDYSNNVATNFSGTVSLSSAVSNQIGVNMDFEAGTLAPWTPLNLGVSPGPYQLATFDVPGSGTPSTAFRILANSGAPDGITQNIPLIGGTTYTADMDIASDNESIDINADGGTTAILIGGTTVAQHSFGQISNGQVLRYHLHGTYTAPTNGLYPLNLTFYRAYLEVTNLWDLADNVHIVGPSSAVSIVPAVSGNFSNGTWSGTITALNNASNAVLTANDGNGHSGFSNPFDITFANDISIRVAAAPSPASAGSNLTYTLIVSNSGPTDATGVTVTNLLPGSVNFVSATSSQGACSQSGGLVIGSLSTVPGGSNATVSIAVVPATAGLTLTNVATVSRAEADAYLANNVATNLTVVTVPAMFIADSSCLEGNVGTTNMIFAVTLSAPSAQTITVNYGTANGTASAGKDYVATSGLITFPAGVTNQTVAVAVIGNTIVEPNKTFFVNLSSPSNATLGRSQAMGTIINDDGLPGQIDHFNWSAIAPTQYVNIPFAATITALDDSNNVASNFTSTVNLSAINGTPGNLHVDFESGLQVFTINNNFGRSNGLWHVSTGRALNPGHSPTHSLYYGHNEGPTGGGNYDTGTANGGVVTSSSIPLPASGAITLSFNYLMSVEQTTSYDQAFIEVSTNNGLSYVTVASKGAGLLYSTAGLWFSNSVPLTQFAGQTILLRFRFDTVDNILNDTEGWYLDDITISTPSTGPMLMVPTNTAAFVGGVWAGSLTVQQPGTNVSVVANDGNGHATPSGIFNVITAAPPVVLVQPVGQTVLGGSNVTFTVTAAGTLPLNYFWQQNNSPLPAPNNPSLVLSNAVRTNSGSYNVVITNIVGVTVSSNAMLIVHVPQLLSNPTWMPDGTLLLNANDFGGGAISTGELANFTAQASSNLVDWVTLPGALTVTNGAIQLHDVGATNAPMQFYRIVEKW